VIPAGRTFRRSQDEEAAHLRDLCAREWDSIHVVSDLHLGEGCIPGTCLFPFTENFACDGAFERFLVKVRDGATRPTLLVLLGDTFDFLRIVRVPEREAEREHWRDILLRLGEDGLAAKTAHPVSGKERDYGLRTDDWKSVWKLAVILDGHAGFLRGLMEWITAGHGLVLSKGNHDVELHWPLVQHAFRDALVTAGTDPSAAQGAVAFALDGFVVGNVYLEHGHQYERMTRVQGPPVLPGREMELNLPLGSFVNRYFINKIERLDPFIDNRKPVQQALFALLRRRPLAIVRIYLHGYAFLEKALSRFFTVQGASAVLLLLVLGIPLVVVPVVMAWILLPPFRHWLLAHIPVLQNTWVRVSAAIGGSLAPVLVPFVVGALREAWTDLFGRPSHDELADGAAARIRERLTMMGEGELWAAMGHTHRQTAAVLDVPHRTARYLNTGTWIALWPEDRPDLAGRVNLSVTRFRRHQDGFSGEPLVWSDDAGELRSATIFTYQ
jgi:UDP-2,3-diacylglucosamine pyrophosphatase LpxH